MSLHDLFNPQIFKLFLNLVQESQDKVYEVRQPRTYFVKEIINMLNLDD